MKPTIAFMTANFVARELGYQLARGWGQGDESVNQAFAPAETYERRFSRLLDEIQAMGFAAVDLWTAHLNWAWATDEHVDIARRALSDRCLRVTSLAGGFGATHEEFGTACRLAQAMGAPLLGGRTELLDTDRAAAMELLERYDLRLGIENHPERHPDEMLAQIGAGGRVGTVVDTGWYGTQGFDAVEAIAALQPHILRVDLKDVRAAGAHHCCGYGEGVVPVEQCVAELVESGYGGVITVEHEPEDYDPSEECRQALAKLHAWLGTHER